MSRRPEAIEGLVQALQRLPGVGSVTAERLAYHLMSVRRQQALELADAIRRVRDEVKLCSVCANLDQSDPCRICADAERDRSLVLVVEGPRDVTSFEAAGFRGLYHVLQGRIAPLEGVQEQDLTIRGLLARVDAGDIREVCLATNPDLEGESTADAIAGLLSGKAVQVTRIARGIPAGAGITQVQHTILADALEGRRKFQR